MGATCQLSPDATIAYNEDRGQKTHNLGGDSTTAETTTLWDRRWVGDLIGLFKEWS